MRAVLPYDASCEDIEVDLSFLDAYVQKSLNTGGSRYLTLRDRMAKKEAETGEQTGAAPGLSILFFLFFSWSEGMG